MSRGGVVCLLMAGCLPRLAAAAPPDELYAGWMKMYDLQFDAAHNDFKAWERAHPENPMGPLSEAAGELFSEFNRLGVLESELFVQDQSWLHRKKLQADPEMKARFTQALERAETLADAALARDPNDSDALLAKSLALGLRADYFGLIEKQNLLPLKLTKESRAYAERLLKADPKDADAHLAPGLENYLLSLKPAPIRLILQWTGSKVDRQAGIEQLKLTAAHGHYLEPFAKLLLAVAALRAKNPEQAKSILRELHDRFPDNPLYVKELAEIKN